MLVLPLILFNLQLFGDVSFFPGGPLDVYRESDPLPQPLAHYDWGVVLG